VSDAFSERREGELELCDLLDAHSGRHASRNHLNHFSRVFTQYVSTDDPATPGLDDQLAETFRLTVSDGSQQILIAR
jgi:hypothetical protein